MKRMSDKKNRDKPGSAEKNLNEIIQNNKTDSFEDHGADSSFAGKFEFEKLKQELGEANSQIDLYQFQVKNLRRDLEQFKIHAVVTNLVGHPVKQDMSAERQREDGPAEDEDIDLDIYFDFYETDDEDENLEAFLEWIEQQKTETVKEDDFLTGPAEQDDTDEDVNIRGLQQNLKSSTDAVLNLDGVIETLRSDVANRDVQIELLKDRIEIEQQKIQSGFVPKQEFHELLQKLEATAKRKRNLEMELRIKENMEQKLNETKERMESVERQSQELEEKYLALKNESQGREQELEKEIVTYKQRIDEAGRELQKTKEAGERQVRHHTERLKKEYAEIRSMIRKRDEALRRLSDEIKRLRSENKSLNVENREMILDLSAARNKSKEMLDENFDEIKQKLMSKFADSASPGTLLELRQLFLQTKQYVDAVRTFRQLLVEPKNQKLMPAVCLLVGEFYQLGGRTEEASFYLANPLIKNDSYAQYLLKKITPVNPGGKPQ